jgi:SagB-type dehydrogenase family enzyme
MALFRKKTPPPDPPPLDPVQIVRGYHQRTKHHPQRYAAALGYLDWETQPDPFRRFDGAPLVGLPRTPAPEVPYAALFTPGAVPAEPLGLEAVSTFLFHALALSAWKSTEGARWSLRVDPSSGNLHPTEGWLLLPALDGLHDGSALWHYAPKEHGLERRATWDAAAWSDVAAHLPEGGFLVALSSVPWRESWKYGERAYRYCQHDVGHALGCLRLSAALLGWSLERVPGLPDDVLAALLGTERDDASHEHEEEVPDLLAVVRPVGGVGAAPSGVALQPALAALSADATFAGTANALSSDHHPWDVIPVIEQVTRTQVARTADPSEAAAAEDLPSPGAGPSAEGPAASEAGTATPAAQRTPPSVPLAVPEALRPPAAPLAATLIRQRRSAVSMDGQTALPRDAFESLLARLVPALTPTPFDALSTPPRVHLALFVHRVDGLDPGLYLLLRDGTGEELLRPRSRPEFTWEHPEGTPAELPLVRLAKGDVRRTAASLSCGQDIAADGVFAVAMLADLGGALTSEGPPAYRALHWEAGLIGQVLYLEAEAWGVRSTGIGCFFDDPTHATLGLTDDRVQTLYHFTVGGPVEDDRLTTEPAYPDAEA